MNFRRAAVGIRAVMKDQRGYTLVELIVATTIFALISVVVVGALVSVIQSSSKTTVERRVQQNARYDLEEIARQTRSASIDYQFYAKNAADPRCAFTPNGANSTQALALVFTDSTESGSAATKRLVYFLNNNALYRYQEPVAGSTPTCEAVFTAPQDAPSGTGRTKLTDDTVAIPVDGLTFYISPNQNPYDTAVPCDSACEVARNTHPRVTTVMTVSTIGAGVGAAKQSGIGSATFETTVGTRAYPTKVLYGPTSLLWDAGRSDTLAFGLTPNRSAA